MQSNGQRVVARRTNLRADHPQLLTAILPHEVTHVVLADLFTSSRFHAGPTKAWPSWPSRAPSRSSARPSSTNRSNRSRLRPRQAHGDGLSANAKDWSLYYAQSVSLTRFLVEQGTPEQFVQFVRDDARARGSSRARAPTGSAGSPSSKSDGSSTRKAQLAPQQASAARPGCSTVAGRREMTRPRRT